MTTRGRPVLPPNYRNAGWLLDGYGQFAAAFHRNRPAVGVGVWMPDSCELPVAVGMDGNGGNWTAVVKVPGERPARVGYFMPSTGLSELRVGGASGLLTRFGLDDAVALGLHARGEVEGRGWAAAVRAAVVDHADCGLLVFDVFPPVRQLVEFFRV